MKTIEEIVEPFNITADEYKTVYNFLRKISTVEGVDSLGPPKNRWLVGAAFARRRIEQREMDMSDFVAITGLGRTSIWHVLKSMESESLIYFSRDPNDKRRQYIKPTEKYTKQSIIRYMAIRDLISSTVF